MKYKKKSTKSRDYDFKTISGEDLDIIYSPQDKNDDFINNISFPDEFPYTRGIHANMYRGK